MLKNKKLYKLITLLKQSKIRVVFMRKIEKLRALKFSKKLKLLKTPQKLDVFDLKSLFLDKKWMFLAIYPHFY